MIGPIVHVDDDDQAVRESLEAPLLVAGYDVQLYASAEDFLARASRDAGCLLLDVNMPRLSGIDLLARLRALGRRDRVLTTGRDDGPRRRAATTGRDDGPRDMALGLGALEVPTKPVPGDELLRAVAEAHTEDPL